MAFGQDVGEAHVSLRLEMERYDRELRTAQTKTTVATTKMGRAFSRVDTGIKGTAAAMTVLVRTMAPLLALTGLASGAGFGALALNAIKAGDEIAKTARRVGVSVEALQELRFAAERSGVSTRGLDDSLQRLQRRFGLLIDGGTSPAKTAFDQLGLTSRIMSGELKGTEQIFFAMVEAMQQIEDQGQRSALAGQMMGDDFGPKMLLVIDQGIKGLKEYAERARELGFVMSDELTKKAEDAQDAFTDLEIAIAGTSRTIGSRFIVALEGGAEALTEWLAVFNQWAGRTDLEKINEELADLIKLQDELHKSMQDPTMVDFAGTERARAASLDARIFKLLELRSALEAVRIEDEKAALQVDIVGGGEGGASSGPRIPPSPRKPDVAAKHIPEAKPEPGFRGEMEAFAITNERIASTTSRWTADLGKAALAGGDLEGIFAGMATSMAEMVVQAILMRAILGAIGGSGGGVIPTDAAGRILGRVQHGGPVHANQPYMVGEVGPELFKPSVPGTIVPNNQLEGGGGGGAVLNIDARQSDPGTVAAAVQAARAIAPLETINRLGRSSSLRRRAGGGRAPF